MIDGNEDVAPNTRGYLITPQLTAGPEGGRCLNLWYNMFYTKGVLQVVMRREGMFVNNKYGGLDFALHYRKV